MRTQQVYSLLVFLGLASGSTWFNMSGGCGTYGEFADGLRLGPGFTEEKCVKQCVNHNKLLQWKNVEVDTGSYHGKWTGNRYCTAAELLTNRENASYCMLVDNTGIAAIPPTSAVHVNCYIMNNP